MAINLPNFLHAPLHDTVFTNLLGKVMEGYRAGKEPEKLRQEAQARELQNAFSQMQNQFYPKVQQQNLDIGDVNLQSGRLNLDALPARLRDEALSRALGLDKGRQDLDKGRLDIESAREDIALSPQRRQLLEAKIQAQLAAAQKSLLPPSYLEREKAFAKKDADQYQESINALSSAQDMKSKFEYLDQLMASPDFKNAVGPLDEYTTSAFGLPGTRAMAGQIDAVTGDLALAVARLEKGQTSDRERAYIENIKPKRGDTFSRFKGKVDALKRIGNNLEQRHALVSQYIRQGSSAHEALEKAKRETPIIDTKKGSEKDPLGIL
jgi:hypothetical protein